MITYPTLTRDHIEPIADFIAALNQERSEPRRDHDPGDDPHEAAWK